MAGGFVGRMGREMHKACLSSVSLPSTVYSCQKSILFTFLGSRFELFRSLLSRPFRARHTRNVCAVAARLWAQGWHRECGHAWCPSAAIEGPICPPGAREERVLAARSRPQSPLTHTRTRSMGFNGSINSRDRCANFSRNKSRCLLFSWKGTPYRTCTAPSLVVRIRT